MPSIAIAVAIVSLLLFCRKLLLPDERKTQRASERRNHSKPTPFRPPSVDAIAAELGRKALGYAIYRELMKISAPRGTKVPLYEKYSYVNLPPSLESESIFAEHPELMSDRGFLENLNAWIVKNGGTAQPSFFAASDTIGALLVESKKGEAQRIVAESVALTTG